MGVFVSYNEVVTFLPGINLITSRNAVPFIIL